MESKIGKIRINNLSLDNAKRNNKLSNKLNTLRGNNKSNDNK